jgi:hypothetical protein
MCHAIRVRKLAMINDYITGYMGAIGAIALGLVDPGLAGRGDEHTLREALPYDAPSPLGDIHMLARALLADPAFVAQSSPGPSWVQLRPVWRSTDPQR